MGRSFDSADDPLARTDALGPFAVEAFVCLLREDLVGREEDLVAPFLKQLRGESVQTRDVAVVGLRLWVLEALDSRQLLCVVLAGDARLVERLRSPDLIPLGSRIRRRLVLDYATRDELLACLDHLLDAAGNPSLMTTELKATLADHAAGNYRVMMTAAGELLLAAAEREVAQIDEKLYFEIFDTRTTRRSAARARSRA